jgi:hypothetical protein
MVTMGSDVPVFSDEDEKVIKQNFMKELCGRAFLPKLAAKPR